MKRAVSVSELLNTKFDELEFTDKWLASFGKPERGGTIIIYGLPKNGKTSMALQLLKYLTRFGRSAYNSIEEGRSLSFKRAIENANMAELGKRFIIMDKWTVDEMTERLKKQKSPDFIVIDSVQFAELTFKQYKDLKTTFPNKTFIYVSHVDGKQPDGAVAKRIKRDADIYMYVEGFTAYPTGRHGGGVPFIIWPERAAEYGCNDSNNN